MLRALVALACLLLLPAAAQAHELRTDGAISIIFHTDPDDAPVTDEPTRFLFEVSSTDSSFSLTNCDCQLSLSQADSPLYAAPLRPVSGDGLFPAGFSYTLPRPGEYAVRVSGAPLSGATFPAFSMSWPVRAESAPIPSPNSAYSWLSSPRVTFPLLGAAIALILGLAFAWHRRGPED